MPPPPVPPVLPQLFTATIVANYSEYWVQMQSHSRVTTTTQTTTYAYDYANGRTFQSSQVYGKLLENVFTYKGVSSSSAGPGSVHYMVEPYAFDPSNHTCTALHTSAHARDLPPFEIPANATAGGQRVVNGVVCDAWTVRVGPATLPHCPPSGMSSLLATFYLKAGTNTPVRVAFNSSSAGAACAVYYRWGNYTYSDFSTTDVNSSVFQPDTRYACTNLTTKPSQITSHSRRGHATGGGAVAVADDAFADDAATNSVTGDVTDDVFYTHINSGLRSGPLPDWRPSAGAMASLLPVNAPGRIRAISARIASANGSWTAGRNRAFDGLTVREWGQRALPFMRPTLPPDTRRSTPTPSASWASAVPPPVPASFDAREQWPQCGVIQTIVNQGMCGSCFAISSSNSLAARTCVATKARFNSSLSAE